MRLQKIAIEAFGKLVKLNFDFHPQLNLIFGPNEIGKSTFQQAILHFLYGFFQTNRATPQESDLLKRYQPWLIDVYSGQLEYQLRDESKFQVNRNFSDPDIPTNIFDALTGQDITNQFTMKRHGNISFLKDQIGLDKDIFEATVFVKQAEVKAIAGSSHLVNEILGVLDSGTRDKSAKLAINHLQQEVTRIGSDRAQKRPLPQAKILLEKLLHEFNAQSQARKELKEAILEKNTLENQIEKKNIQRIELNYVILTKSIELKEKQLNRLRVVRKESDKLEEKKTDYTDVENFPEEIRDSILRRLNNRKNYQDQIKEKNGSRTELKSQVQALEQEIRPIKHYEKVYSFMSYNEFFNLSEEWKRRNSAFNDAQQNMDKEELILLQDGIEPKVLQELNNLSSSDFSKFSQAEEKIKGLEDQHSDLQEQLDQLERQTWATGKTRHMIIFLTSVLILASLLLSYFFKFIYGYPISAGILLLGVIVFYLYQKAREKIAVKANQLEEQLYSIRKEIDSISFEIQRHYQHFGVDSINKLIERRMQNEQYLNLVRKREEAFKERDRVEFQLLKYLQSININKIDEQGLHKIDGDYKQYHELFAKKKLLEQDLHQLEKGAESLKNRLQDNDSALKELFSQLSLEIEELSEAETAFEKLHHRNKELNGLKRNQEKLKSEINGLLASQTENEILDELDELMIRREKLLANYPEVRGKHSNKTLQYLEKNFLEIDQERQQYEKQVQALQTRIETVLEQHRPQAEIEEELSQVKEEVKKLEETRSTLELAKGILTEVAFTYHRNVVPFINKVLSEAMDLITDNRYSEVRVNPNDLSLNVVLPEKQSPGSSDVLSLGTQEQLYLLLRIALARLLSQNMEPLPLILDDPFVHFDHNRMANMMKFLSNLSCENQVLIFTKEPFIVDWCRKNLNEKKYSEFDLLLHQNMQTNSNVT